MSLLQFVEAVYSSFLFALNYLLYFSASFFNFS